jgi:RNA polymerase sigma-70 factor (ECF subfamily)
MQLDDKTLIDQILQPAAGLQSDAAKRVAFGHLVRRYQGLVLSVVFAMVKNDETARDLTQETFLKAFRALSQFDTSRSFKPWLLRIANNSTLDYLRTRQNKEEVSLDLIMEEDPGLEPFDNNDPSEIADHNLFIEKLGVALKLLPLRYRQAFVLRYQFDLTYEEIAEVMQESENNVRTLLFRARDRLRKLLLESPKKGRKETNKNPKSKMEDHHE